MNNLKSPLLLEKELLRELEHNEGYLEEIESEIKMTQKLTNKNVNELLSLPLSDGSRIIDVIGRTKDRVKEIKEKLSQVREQININKN